MTAELETDPASGRVQLTLFSTASGARLIIVRDEDSMAREVATYDATLTVAGMHATTAVYTYGDDGLPAFCRGLADSWRGWEGTRQWNSLEGQLNLDAESDRLGHVTVRASVRPSAHPHTWSAALSLSFDSGSLEVISSRVTRFFT